MTEEIKEILDRLERIDHKEYSGGFEFADSGSFDEDCRCFEERKKLANYITNLQKENENYKSRNEKAVEYITSYKSISIIQGLDNIEQNKTLDEKTTNIMTDRYLKIHHELLNILQGGDE